MNDTLNGLNALTRAFRFTGREFDPKANLYYYRARSSEKQVAFE
jgi:hypothetical protein